MAFNLPRYQDLNKEEQDPIVNAPLDKSILVSGPPGTGKTVLALYRAHNCKEQRRKFLFLVYNNTLNDYMTKAIEQLGVKGETRTWHKWLREFYLEEVGEKLPRDGKNPFKYDWDQVVDQLGNGADVSLGDVVLDEGQDMPPGFYRMIGQIADNVSVFADENQSVTKDGASIRQIQRICKPDGQYKIARNYRNTRQIAELAQQFYTGASSSLPELPDKRSGALPECIEASKEQQKNFITRYCLNNSRSSIGVLCISQKEVKSMHEMLAGEAKLRNRVEYFISKENNEDRPPLQFEKNSITVTTLHSAKGLEYDRVIIPFLSSKASTNRWDETSRTLFYVAVSRARDHLTFMTDEEPYDVEILANVDEELIEWRSL